MVFTKGSDLFRKVHTGLFVAFCLCALMLAGCAPKLKDFRNMSAYERVEAVCKENREITKLVNRLVQLRAGITHTENLIQVGYRVQEKCRERQRYDYKLGQYVKYELCDRHHEPIDRGLEERRLQALRVEEPALNDKYLAYHAQCGSYVRGLSYEKAFEAYKLPYKRWVNPLNKSEVRARRSAIRQIARKFNMRVTVSEARDKGTGSYLLRDITRLEGKFFDREDNPTNRAKHYLSAIVGKYAVRANTPSPPVLEIVVPFFISSDADRFLARERAGERVDALQKHFREMLDIERPIRYLREESKDGRVDFGFDVILIREVATK